MVVVDARSVMNSVKHAMGPYHLIANYARLEVILTVAFAKLQKIMKY